MAYCFIFDSIYGDVALSKVKQNAKQEYEYVLNFKVLQACFKKHNIDKVVLFFTQVIPVDRLVKCKFQDNLEFFQWVKKYWDSYYPGGTYDAMARRKGESSGEIRQKAKKTVHSQDAIHATKERVLLTQELAELKAAMDGLEKERDFY